MPSDGSDVAHGPRTRPFVALTFHGAGDPAIAGALLGELERAGVAATVLAVGTWLEQQPTMARRILDGGHELGNHTWSHQQMRSLTATAAQGEVQRCADQLTRLTGSQGSWFRPSGTPASTPTIRAAARSAGYTFCLTYDVDSLDYQDPGPARVVSNTMATVQPGSIISLHFGHAGTVAAIPSLLEGLRARGLSPVTVGRLFA